MKDRKAHGLKVLAKINAQNKARLLSELPSHNAPCASGTWLTDGNDILKHMRRKQLAKLEADAKRDRTKRTDAQVERLYNEAMLFKRQQYQQQEKAA